MDALQIEMQAMEYRAKYGGIFFTFPIEPDNPHSLYAFAMYDGSEKAAVEHSFLNHAIYFINHSRERKQAQTV